MVAAGENLFPTRLLCGVFFQATTNLLTKYHNMSNFMLYIWLFGDGRLAQLRTPNFR